MTAPTPGVSFDFGGATAVTEPFTVDIQRGRSSPLFEQVEPGIATVGLNNEARKYDPLYSSSPYNGHIIPGKEATITAGGVTIYTGFVSDWNLEYDVSGKSNAYARLEDGLARLGRTEFDEWTSTYGQLPGARLTAALARSEVDYAGTTSFDDGVFTLGSDLITWGSNVLNYCQLIAKTDDGLFFVDRAGVLKFLDRHHFINSTSAATIGTGGIKFSAITTSYGSELLYNRVAVAREGGEQQSVDDDTSISTYGGVFTLRRSGLLMENDTQALDLASYLLSVYKDPLYRVESVTIDVHGLGSSDQSTLLGLDIGSVVTVAFTPNGVGTQISRTCIVEGIRHSMSPAVHVTTLTLNDSTTLQTGNFWTVEDATYGSFDGSGVLEYPVAF